MMPQITTQETKWLARIEKRLRQVTHALMGGGGGVTMLMGQFTIGDGGPLTPVAGSTMYADPTLDGLPIKVFKNGVGYLTEGVHFDLLPGGGFTLLGGAQFTAPETYLVFKV